MRRALTYLLFTGFLLLLCRYHYNHPGYNWDILPYMGVVLKMDNAANVHQQVYTIAKEEVPSKNYDQLTDSSHQYRWSVFRSEENFMLQLPYYVVKPLYTGLTYILFKAGLPLTKATLIPSLLACFLIGMLLLYWMERYVPVIVAMIAAVAIMIWNPMMHLARTSSPDALSALLLFAAGYILAEKKNPVWIYLLALLSIFARIDNVLPAVLFIFLMTYEKRSEGKRTLLSGITAAVACIICYLAVGSLAREYHWNMLYFSNYFTRMNPEYQVQDGFTIKNYWALMKSQAMSGLYYSQLPLFFFLSLCLFIYRLKIARTRSHPEVILIAGIWLIIALRFILHPMVADRIYVGYYLVILVLLVKSMYTHVLKPVRQT